VFACHDAGELRIVNVTNPSNPFEVARYSGGLSILHDVYVRDNLAFVSHWDVGLVILDVGNAIAGGSPGSPVEVSRLDLAEGRVHNAWYWPARGLVFVGHEGPGSVFNRLSSGLISVIDVSDLHDPQRVATFRLPDAGPHNFWVVEDAGVLYSAYYNAGLLAIDVNGPLLGELDRQGRLIDRVQPGGDGNTFVWAPQVVEPGLVFLSDMISGLWAVEVTGPGP
ncbi:MAG: LVIVD repeat-containing protein, partial [Gemmatimonadota bacterium]